MNHRLLLLSLLTLAACRPVPEPPAQLEPPPVVLPETVRLLDPTAAQAFIESQPRLQIIDCRTEEEYRHARLPGAHHTNYFTPEEARRRLEALDRERPCLIYCALGGRSRELTLVLHELGFREIHLLDGGMAAWLANGLPVSR
jgi:rhodanese-related sulfurtransferase